MIAPSAPASPKAATARSTSGCRAATAACRSSKIAEPRSASSPTSIAATSAPGSGPVVGDRSEEHTSELQSHSDLVCRLLLEKKKNTSEDDRAEARARPTA